MNRTATRVSQFRELNRRVVPILKLTSETAGQMALVGEFVGPLNEMFALLEPLIEVAPPISLSLKYEDYIDAVLRRGETAVVDRRTAFRAPPAASPQRREP